MDEVTTAAEQAAKSTTGAGAGIIDHVDVLSALARLDRLLEQAFNTARATYGREAADDRFRGLHVTTAAVEHSLGRAPGTSPLWSPSEEHAVPAGRSDRHTRLSWLAEVFGLAPFELDIVLIALAPEVDLRYERIYAYLQDDVTRRRPSVDLVLNLLCSSAEERLARRACLSSESPLVRHRLIRLIPDPQQVEAPLLAHYIKLDEQIVRLLLYERGIDARLQSFCEWAEPGPACTNKLLPQEIETGTRSLVINARQAGEPLRLYFQGPDVPGKRRCAEALAAAMGTALLRADLGRLGMAAAEFAETLKVLFREAWFQDALLFLDGLDAILCVPGRSGLEDLLDELAETGGITIMAGTTPWCGSKRRAFDVATVSFRLPEFEARRTEWRANLEARGLSIDGSTLDALADRFRMSTVQIADAVSSACNRAELHTHSTTRVNTWATSGVAAEAARARRSPSSDDLFAGARAQSGDSLAALAHRIEPRYGWKDLVLPLDSITQLHEICQRVAHRHRVLGEWGFDRKLSLGKGVNALFAGPPGTGKTMAAEIIANELELDLYRIDLAGVVSKYIGETEKNLDRVFSAAEGANAILFFDEADALFGKRSEVRDSHDRYANLEISYLLQKMEEHEGVAILATNLRQNLDDAFMRRVAFTVHFPFPDESSRRRIWEQIWPPETPLADDVNFDAMARRFRLSGGNIKNIALASAFLAAEDGGRVTMAHLQQATRREHQKMGKTLIEPEAQALDREAQVVTTRAFLSGTVTGAS